MIILIVCHTIIQLFYKTDIGIMNYFHQQMTNLMPVLTILKLLFIVSHTALNFALSVYLITSLILAVLIILYIIIKYYDTMLYIPKKQIFQYSTILIFGTFIKEYVLFTKVLMFLNNFSENLLLSIIRFILFIMKVANQCITTLQEQPIGNIIIYIVLIKVVYSVLKTGAVVIRTKYLINVYYNIYDIGFEILSIILYIILTLALAIITSIYIKYNTVELNNADIEIINELLNNHLFNV